MSKNLLGTICVCIMMITGGACSLGYVLGNPAYPWWLLPVAGGIACAILSMVVGFKNETDENQKSKKFIGCICASISMISVLAFLAVMMLTAFDKAWVIVFVGGIASGVTYMIYNAVKKENK